MTFHWMTILTLLFVAATVASIFFWSIAVWGFGFASVTAAILSLPERMPKNKA